MNPSTWAFLGAAMTAVVLAGQRVWEHRRSGPTAASQLTAAASDLVGPLRSELNQLRDDIETERAECSARIDTLQAHVTTLQADNQQLRDEVAGLKAVIRMRKTDR